jgi:molybdenum cofactor guanylyltransferase
VATQPITTAVMAGGKSSRMGTDKAFVPLLGKPMVEHVLDRIAGLADETIIITNRPACFDYLGLPLYTDIYRERGPLGGLHTALRRANHPHVLIVACDMPWLNRSLLEYLLSLREAADAVIPRWIRHPEPLHAVYSRSCLGAIETNLQAERLKLADFFEQVRVRYVDRAELARFDPEGRSFANVNTPQELEAAGLGSLPDNDA